MLYPKDPKVQVERHDKTLKIEWRNGHIAGLLLTLFGIVMCILAWFGSLVPNPSDELHPVIHVWGLFFGMSAFLGVFPILAGIVFAFNRTIVHADHERLTARIVPFSFRKPLILRGTELSQFFIAPCNASLALYVMDAEHFQRILASNFPSSFAAYQVCHELQDWFGLEDLPVFGHTDLPHQPGPRSK